MMGSAHDFLSYFVMGTEGMKRFARDGTLNTDDNLYLEFSAPFSIASPALVAANVAAITASREGIVPYLRPAADAGAAAARRQGWDRQLAAARVGDAALTLFLGREQERPGTHAVARSSGT